MSAEQYRRQAGVFGQPSARAAPPDVRALGRLPKGTMNKTEAAFARRLDADPDVAWWAFEAVKLTLAANTSITVDFFVMRASGRLEAIDVKGSAAIVTDDSRAKLKIAAAAFPWPFFMAFPRPAREGGGWVIEEVRG